MHAVRIQRLLKGNRISQSDSGRHYSVILERRYFRAKESHGVSLSIRCLSAGVIMDEIDQIASSIVVASGIYDYRDCGSP